jgi:excisionase family DNA binding protein
MYPAKSNVGPALRSPEPSTLPIEHVGHAYLTIPECAEIARCSECTIRRAIRSRRLASRQPSGRGGQVLVRRDELIRYLDANRIAAVGENAVVAEKWPGLIPVSKNS